MQLPDRAGRARRRVDQGEVDLAPEYLGGFTLFTNADATVPDRADRAAEQLRELLAPKGLTVLKPAEAEDTNAFVVTRATAQPLRAVHRLGLGLGRRAAGRGRTTGVPKRPSAGDGLKQTYGLTFNV